jgi:hypothetical protein
VSQQDRVMNQLLRWRCIYARTHRQGPLVVMRAQAQRITASLIYLWAVYSRCFGSTIHEHGAAASLRAIGCEGTRSPDTGDRLENGIAVVREMRTRAARRDLFRHDEMMLEQRTKLDTLRVDLIGRSLDQH